MSIFERKTVRVGTVREFLQKETKAEPTTNEKVFQYLEDNRFLFQTVGLGVVALVGLPDVGFASSGIDAKANILYGKLLEVGKWIIIFKGGFEIIKSASGGDMDSFKKVFIQYALIYLALLGFPWAMDQIDLLFREVS